MSFRNKSITENFIRIMKSSVNSNKIDLKNYLSESSVEDYADRPYRVIEDFYKGDVPVDTVIQVGNMVNKEIATFDELSNLLDNKFLIGLQAEMLGVSEEQIVSKTKKLMKALEIY